MNYMDKLAAAQASHDSEVTQKQKESVFRAIMEEIMELEDNGLGIIDLEDLRKAHRALRERRE